MKPRFAFLIWLLAGCGEPDLTHFTCDDAHACPDGQHCDETLRCVASSAPGSIDLALLDLAPRDLALPDSPPPPLDLAPLDLSSVDLATKPADAQSCGAPNQPCCPSNACNAGATCVGTTCEECGNAGDRCCPSPQAQCTNGMSCTGYCLGGLNMSFACCI